MLTVSSLNLDEKQMRRGCIFRCFGALRYWGWGGTEGWLVVGVEISGASQEDAKAQLAMLVLEYRKL